jgi:hypothetical protein
MRTLLSILVFILPIFSFANDWKIDAEIKSALAEVNRMRKDAGLDPVIISEQLSEGCYSHAKYLVINRTSEKVKGLKAHKEFPELKGYSKEGQKAGKNSVINYLTPTNSVKGWEATFYHRIPLLQPNLKEVGIAYYQVEGYWPVCLIDCTTGVKGNSEIEVVYFPKEGQENVPIKMGAEIPHPMGSQGDYGFPLTIYFTKWQTITEVRFELLKNGELIDCLVSTPENPATSFSQWNTICAIPKKPLLTGSSYTINITCRVNGTEFKKKIEFKTVLSRVGKGEFHP